MSEHGLTRQSDLDELSAWLDGELDPPSAERVARLVCSDPDWQATCEQFRAVSACMELLPPVGPARDLTDGIVRTARRRRRIGRAAGVLVPLAAAAGLAVAVMLAWPSRPAGPEAPAGVQAKIETILEDVPRQDRPIVRNLSFFQNYREVVDYQQVRQIVDAETVSALADMEAEESL